MTMAFEQTPSLPSSPHRSTPTAPTSIAHIVDPNPIPPVYPSSAEPAHAAQPPMPPTDGKTVEERCAPIKTVYDGRLYSLHVVQQPVRARMCGFGDKDRRPITPPPCIQLVVQDATTEEEIDINEIDTSYFVLTVDLWSADGWKEVNLVRHSATSPSISAATSASYPPPNIPDLYAMNVGPFRSPPRRPAYTNPLPTTAPGPYPTMPPSTMGSQYPLPKQNELSRHIEQYREHRVDYALQHHHQMQPQQQVRPQQSMHPQQVPPQQQMYPQQQMHPQQQMPNQGRPTYMAYQQPQPQIIYPPNHGAPGPQPPTALTSYHQQQPQPQGPLLSPDQIPPNTDPRSQPSGMFTRNLIGSLCVSAFKLFSPPNNQLGVWFILQDLSVRTEGPFRLKMNFVNVGNSSELRAAVSAPQNPLNPPAQSTPLQTGTLNTSSAPVLASAFSDVFQVFSAKKFPGVIESTELSRDFARQGIKIPIRKDGPRGNERRPDRRGGDDDDDEGEGGEEGGD